MTAAVAIQNDGWKAELDLGFRRRRDRTVLAHRRQRGPLAVQRPFYPEQDVCHVYLLHPPGGVVGGDQLITRVHAASGSAAVLTTPGATKFYRSAGPRARLNQSVEVEAGATLEWLPQESIFFPAAEADMRTEVNLRSDSRFLGWETVCLGRPANGERFDAGQVSLALRINLDERPLLLERLNVEPSLLDGASGLRGQPVSATFTAFPADGDDLNAVREIMKTDAGESAAATLVDGLLVVRFLGRQAEAARRCFIPIWETLRPRLLGRRACPPRIWAT